MAKCRDCDGSGFSSRTRYFNCEGGAASGYRDGRVCGACGGLRRYQSGADVRCSPCRGTGVIADPDPPDKPTPRAADRPSKSAPDERYNSGRPQQASQKAAPKAPKLAPRTAAQHAPQDGVEPNPVMGLIGFIIAAVGVVWFFPEVLERPYENLLNGPQTPSLLAGVFAGVFCARFHRQILFTIKLIVIIVILLTALVLYTRFSKDTTDTSFRLIPSTRNVANVSAFPHQADQDRELNQHEMESVVEFPFARKRA